MTKRLTVEQIKSMILQVSGSVEIGRDTVETMLIALTTTRKLCSLCEALWGVDIVSWAHDAILAQSGLADDPGSDEGLN